MLQDRRSDIAQGKALISPAADLPVAGTRGGVLKVGADLRIARERLGWDIEAIAAHLRIRHATLCAIEDGRLADLPPGAYAVGFLRTYAGALGLDVDDITRRFRAEAAELTRKPELTFPAPVPERGVPAGAVVLMGAVLAVGAYAGWFSVSGNRPAEEPVRQVPQRLAALVQPPPPPPAQAVAEAPPAPQQQQQQQLVIAALPPAAVASVPPTSAAAAIPAASVFGPPMAATQVPSGAGLPPLPEGTRIVLRAHADSWLQVRERQGPVLLNRVLRAGETWPVPVGKSAGQLLMTTGNAGGTEVLVDGQLSPALGADGVVRRDLPLDPDAIRDGQLVPPMAAARPAPRQP